MGRRENGGGGRSGHARVPARNPPHASVVFLTDDGRPNLHGAGQRRMAAPGHRSRQAGVHGQGWDGMDGWFARLAVSQCLAGPRCYPRGCVCQRDRTARPDGGIGLSLLIGSPTPSMISSTRVPPRCWPGSGDGVEGIPTKKIWAHGNRPTSIPRVLDEQALSRSLG